MTWTPPIWITLPGLRRYAVSDRGVVRNGRRELETQLNDEGYPKLKLVGDDGVRRGYFVHVLVARAFLPPPAIDQTMVLHRNGCRTQCDALNLRWGTHAANHEDKVAHGTAARGAVRKLSLRDVRRIRRMKIGAAAIARRPGRYRRRVPDCPECRRQLITALVAAQATDRELVAALWAPVISPPAPVKRGPRKRTQRALSKPAQKRRRSKARKPSR